MKASILVIGATGNTGRAVMHSLPGFLGPRADQYRIIGTTRSLASPAASALSKLPHVEMTEKEWSSIDAAWLKEQCVERAYVVVQVSPSQFMDETDLYVAMLEAGVKYVVKLSTSEPWVSPSCRIAFARAHWAAEQLLATADFRSMHHTCLRPTLYTKTAAVSSIKWLQKAQTDLLPIFLDEHVPAAPVDPEDVGIAAAKLLSLEDTSIHNGARYQLTGPKNLTGAELAQLLQEVSGVKAKQIVYKDATWTTAAPPGPPHDKIVKNSKAVADSVWAGEHGLSRTQTSPQILQLGLQMREAKDSFAKLVKELSTA